MYTGDGNNPYLPTRSKRHSKARRFKTARFADWFGKPKSITGLGYDDAIVSAVRSVLIVILVGYLTISRRDVPKDE